MLPAIVVENLSKTYHLYQKNSDRLKEGLWGWTGKKYYNEFNALENINLTVNPGECVGVVGRNGSGKSTLLQLIAGTLAPSRGRVTVRGRLAALLELGSGFSPDYSGRENVLLNAAILGLKPQEIRARMDEIIDFADIGEFIDQPVRTYSSGMYVRLAFAVNAVIRPDVLIVDEALAVGDAPFQAKCFRYLRELMAGGATILFVSHAVEMVRGICNRALWLDEGRERMHGPAVDVAWEYEQYCFTLQGTRGLDGPDADNGATEETEVFTSLPLPAPAPTDNPQTPYEAIIAALFQPDAHLSGTLAKTRTGTGEINFIKAVFADAQGRMRDVFDYGEDVRIYFLMRSRKPFQGRYRIGAVIRDLMHNDIFRIEDLRNTHHDASAMSVSENEYFIVSINFKIMLTHKKYSLSVVLLGFGDEAVDAEGHYNYIKSACIDYVPDILFFEVRPFESAFAGPVFTFAQSTFDQVNMAGGMA